MIGYKVAKNSDTRVVITLEIPEDAHTNMERSSIAVKETAKHRTHKAKVLAIEDASGISYTTASSFNYNKKFLTYTVGEMIEEPSYNPDPEKVCAEGIHYFLTRRVAELYGLPKVENGLFQSWYDNGQKDTEAPYVDGKLHGLYQYWHSNGQKMMEATYVEGKRQGLSQYWHSNGQKSMEATYVDMKLHGLSQAWYVNGQKSMEATYVDGKNHGLYMSWHKNGHKYEEAHYVDGNLHGLLQAWHENGQKWEEATYVDGKRHGLFKSWCPDGAIDEEATYEHGVKGHKLDR